MPRQHRLFRKHAPVSEAVERILSNEPRTEDEKALAARLQTLVDALRAADDKPPHELLARVVPDWVYERVYIWPAGRDNVPIPPYVAIPASGDGWRVCKSGGCDGDPLQHLESADSVEAGAQALLATLSRRFNLS